MSIFHPRAASRPHVAPDALRPARSPRVCARRAAIALTSALTLVLGLGGCSDDGNDAAATATTYSVGGSVAGLTTASLVLANGSDTASLAAGAKSACPKAPKLKSTIGLTMNSHSLLRTPMMGLTSSA